MKLPDKSESLLLVSPKGRVQLCVTPQDGMTLTSLQRDGGWRALGFLRGK